MKAFKVRLEKFTLNTVICYVIFENIYSDLILFTLTYFYTKSWKYLKKGKLTPDCLLYKKSIIINFLDSFQKKVCIYLNVSTCNMGLLRQVL